MHARAIAISILLSSVAVVGSAHETSESRYNYRTHVRPIFVEHCGGCHINGGVAPMSLLEYAEAVPWVNAIKMQVLERTMPPWLPADGIGDFRHQRSLSAEEIDILVDWAIGLTPEGASPAPEPAADESAAGWSMGEPDWTLIPDEEIVIGEDDYELQACRVLSTTATESSMATAFEVRPVLAGLLRRVTIRLGGSCDVGVPLATWLPGQGNVALAGGAALAIPAAEELAVSFSYAKSWEDEGKRLTDRSAVGVWLTPTANAVRSIEITEASYPFTEEVELLAFFPGALGDDEGSLRVDMKRPDGTTEQLLLIEDIRPAWIEKYVFAEPLVVPSGSELILSHPAAWIDVRPTARGSSAGQ